MAKKYLLYIHDERFANEKEKSALVNKLLETHYGNSVEEMVKIKRALHEPPIVKPAVSAARSNFSWGATFCKEGHPVPEGRSKCMGKGCKYS